MPMWRTGDATRVMPCSSASRRILSTFLPPPCTSSGAPYSRQMPSTYSMSPVRRVPADEAVQPAADVRRERELAVAEGAGAAPAAGDVAGLAAGADAGLARRAGAAVDVGAALDDEHAGAVAAHELECGEDAGGAGADDDHVIVRACGIHGRWAGEVDERAEAVPFSG